MRRLVISRPIRILERELDYILVNYGDMGDGGLDWQADFMLRARWHWG